FHQQVVHRLGADHQARVLKLGAVAVVEFVAVAVALGHHVPAVDRVRPGAGLEPLLLQAQAHGAAHVAVLAAALDLAAAGAPFGDQADHRVRGLAVVLGAVGTLEASHVPGHVHHRGLHAVADPEVGDALFAGVLRRQHLALEAAVAETARYQDAVEPGQDLVGAVALDVLGFDPFQVDPGALADAAVAQRLGHRLVGVLVVDVLADHADGDLVDRVFG